MVRNAARLIGMVAIACAIGCDEGGSGSVVSAPLAIVSVSPPNPVVPQATSADFEATVTTDAIGVKDSVHWRVEGTGCTGDDCGTITSIGPQTGRFVAPLVAPIPSTVAVIAISDSDDDSFGVSYVTIGTTPVSVTIDPPSAGVANCGRQVLTATVDHDSAEDGVAWSLEGGLCDVAPCGTIFPGNTDSGDPATYTGPCSSSLPIMTTVRVRATSLSDPSRSATASMTVMR